MKWTEQQLAIINAREAMRAIGIETSI